MGDEPETILATSQAFQYLNEGSWEQILRYADLVVFDEFTNSGAGAVEGILGFLRKFSKNPSGTKVMILDASMTHPDLYIPRPQEAHLRPRNGLYSPGSSHIKD
ncbi:hypothetical protein [Thermococcus sp. JCM 11816]|uniref:hypothetical protein n=1 Tax=Thermococcus sp. (strain JCM 11816 / KS-1) TaxID=1295125 RepID=UPI0006D0F504